MRHLLKLILTPLLLLNACSFSVIPLPENAQYEKRQFPALFVNQDVTGFEATPDKVIFASLRSTEPMKAQAEGVKEVVRIKGLFNLTETGIKAAENVSSEVIEAVK